MSSIVSVNDLILSAVCRGDAHEVRNMIGHGASPHSRYEHGSTLLHWAARLADDRACLEVMAALIAGGADVNAQSDDGRTALHVCVEEDNAEGARMILHFGGDVLCIDTLGRAPLDALTDPADANAFDFLRRAAQEAAAAHPRTRVTTDVGGGPSIAATAGTRTVSLGPEIGAGPARTPASRSVACRTDREREESRGPADRSLEKLILGLGLGGSIPSPPPPPPPPVVAEAPMRGQGDPQAWPMMLKFGRNTNPAAHAVPTPQHTAAAAAETQTAASVAEAEEEEVGAAELGEAVEALRMEELQRAVQRREGSGAAAMATAPSGSVLSTLGGEIHVFQNARNYIRLELSTSESMSFGVGHEGAGSVGAAGEEPAAAHRASAGVGQDSAEDAVAGGVGAGDAGLGVDFAYDVVSESGTVAVSKLGAGAGSEVGARGVTIRLGADGKLSEADYARVRAAARN